MSRILFLAHRIPYPPNKGDKIRSWHFLRHLAAHHELSLACFVDDPDDMRHAEMLRGICADSHFEPLARSPLQWRNAAAMATGSPITVSHYRSRRMRARVESLLAGQPDFVFVFSGAMAQYLPERVDWPLRRIIDFADVDSDKWAQYARQRKAPASLIYRREARTLLGCERAAAARADAVLFVSEVEADLFRALAPESAGKVHAIRNGVDYLQFSPEHELPSPFSAAARPLVFTGMMDYWANVDGAAWFVDQVLPRIRQKIPAAEFWIVGASPAPAVRALAERPGVHVTGRVPDVRPYLRHAAVVAVPLRIARGVQNKVLEAMAMARPVVTTPAAAQGVDGAVIGHELIEAGDEAGFADAVCMLLRGRDEAEEMGRRARARVLADYDWGSNLGRLDDVMGPAPERSVPRDSKMVAGR